eukprot:1182171-Prorocentrum_minimum.AAC.1
MVLVRRLRSVRRSSFAACDLLDGPRSPLAIRPTVLVRRLRSVRRFSFAACDPSDGPCSPLAIRPTVLVKRALDLGSAIACVT